MKHLKKWNEELDPETYLSAGNQLRKKGHEERGKKLTDFGASKITSPTEFKGFVSGSPITIKWEFDKGNFTTDLGGFVRVDKGGVAISGVFRRGGYSSWRCKERKEAIALLNLIQKVGYPTNNLPNINDLYNETADVKSEPLHFHTNKFGDEKKPTVQKEKGFIQKVTDFFSVDRNIPRKPPESFK